MALHEQYLYFVASRSSALPLLSLWVRGENQVRSQTEHVPGAKWRTRTPISSVESRNEGSDIRGFWYQDTTMSAILDGQRSFNFKGSKKHTSTSYVTFEPYPRSNLKNKTIFENLIEKSVSWVKSHFCSFYIVEKTWKWN